MIRYAIIWVVMATTVYAIDKTVFKNCSQIEFCNRLRNNVLDDKLKYTADLDHINENENILTVPLINENGDKLNLLLSFLAGNDKLRVKVQEPDSKRFELGDIIIEKKVEEIPIVYKKEDRGLTITPKEDNKPQKVVITSGNPFTVEFYNKDKLQVVLDGERVVMESTKESQAFTFKARFPGASRLYGLHDHAWTMSLGDTNNGKSDSTDPFRLRNSDSWGYEANSPMALYGSRPVVYGHSTNSTSGIFLHNAAEQWIDAASSEDAPSVYFMVQSAAFDLFILLGPTPTDIVRQFTGLTGKAHLPQIWALGYHQCRFSYKSQDDVKEVAALLDENYFPWDAIWLDGDHTDDYKWFHWNHTTYPDPMDLMRNISARDRVCVSISDPHIKVDDDYDVYAGAKGKYFTKWENGTEYQADCWPGLSSWIDFMNPEASDYYGDWYTKFNGTDETLAGIWNDMNEPAVFDDNTEKTMPWEVLHEGNVKHGDIHNIYGFMQVRSTHKGLLKRDNNQKRPFILTRSHFAGSQRFAAMWTGDNTASWEHFANTYSECMTANMMGMVFCGADIGGFIGDPSDELLQRWYQGAVWLPFFRGHSSREAKRREPYLFTKKVQDVLRNTLQLRYKHIPTFYTLFFEHTRIGDPIIRPLYYQYPEVDDKDTQVLVGTDIMAVAVTKEGVNSVDVYFPGKNSDDPFDKKDQHWYRIDNDSWQKFNPGSTVSVDVDISSSPVFYRAGSIIFRKDIIRKSAVAAKDDPYTIYINLDQESKASGRLYVDDYYSFNYTNNKYVYIRASHEPNGAELQLDTIDGDGSGINVFAEKIVINHWAATGELTTRKITYDKERGIPLKDINIAEELRSQRSEKLIIKL